MSGIRGDDDEHPASNNAKQWLVEPRQSLGLESYKAI